MHTSQDSQSSTSFHGFYPLASMQQHKPYSFSSSQPPNSNLNSKKGQPTEVSFETSDQFFTLESTPAVDFASYSSPSVLTSSSSTSPFSPQCSQSFISDPRHTSDVSYDSPLSGLSGVDDENKLMMQALSQLRDELLGPEPDIEDRGFFDGNGIATQPSYFTKYDQILEKAPRMDLKQLLTACAEIMSESDSLSSSELEAARLAAEALMDMLEKNVSVFGDPLQRLGAYMLEGLRAKQLSSGSTIYKKLKCNEPTSSELMSYMGVLYQICPYYKFAYTSSNVMITEAMENESRIHIIDFQIAQGSQWVAFIQAVSRRPGGPPFVRVTGVDDSQSEYARGGGLHLVGQKLAQVAESCGVPFEFNAAAISGTEVQLHNLQIRYGEALAVNFPYVLHHMPDESVSTVNHRDRLLRLIKSLSPKIVVLVEQESNTNTGTFFQRFCETLDYYTAMFESIDAARKRDDKQRTSAEEHCVAKDVVNIIACEGIDRVERHELYGKWRVRLTMAGYSQLPLSSSVSYAVGDLLREYNSNYRIAEGNGALYLGWKNRALVTCSAWR